MMASSSSPLWRPAVQVLCRDKPDSARVTSADEVTRYHRWNACIAEAAVLRPGPRDRRRRRRLVVGRTNGGPDVRSEAAGEIRRPGDTARAASRVAGWQVFAP